MSSVCPKKTNSSFSVLLNLSVTYPTSCFCKISLNFIKNTLGCRFYAKEKESSWWLRGRKFLYRPGVPSACEIESYRSMSRYNVKLFKKQLPPHPLPPPLPAPPPAKVAITLNTLGRLFKTLTLWETTACVSNHASSSV